MCGLVGAVRDLAGRAKRGLGAPNLLSAALYGKFMRREREWKGGRCARISMGACGAAGREGES